MKRNEYTFYIEDYEMEYLEPLISKYDIQFFDNGLAVFKTTNREELCKDLDKVMDFGACTASDILQ